MTFYLDSNVIIDLLNGNSNVLAAFKNAYIFDSVRIPDLVYYEVLRGFEYSDPKKQKAGFEFFAQKCGIERMDLQSLRESARQYADLRKRGIAIDDDDILIGSLALVRGATLVTNNTKHFQNLGGIQLVNWKEP
ncbi:MAG: PIN domain-containing protein [Treponema sp.]|uniref:PIN domain-containing protein n=1 Tax=Treponema sp. TaxID=166 RepID=UPI0025F13819|nr:PIN domain-containing protein [Treponema sp.]MBQ9282244.1 PIN domain-containing protein [Treponema sp.]